MRTILVATWLMLAGILSVPVVADELTLAESAPGVYLVKEEDTLWGIANLFLRDPWRWQDLWQINPQRDKPYLIFPGDQLYLVDADGRPGLRVRRGARSRTVKLTPQMRIEPLDNAIPVIPLEKIGAWLSSHRIVSPEEMEAAPYVIAGDQRRLLSSAGDRIHARGNLPGDETGFGIYRSGQIFVDPLSQQVLGFEAIDIGSVRLIADHDNGVSQLELTRITEEVRIGDRLLANEARTIAAAFRPRAPEVDIQGHMIAVDGGVSQIGTLDIVALNRGQREGIEAGHVMAILQTGETVYDNILREYVQIPDSRAGLLMVFRTFEKMSYGIVLKANRPLAVMDRVVRPWSP